MKKHEQHAEELVILWPYSLYKFILFDAAHKILKGLEHVKPSDEMLSMLTCWIPSNPPTTKTNSLAQRLTCMSRKGRG